MSTQQGARATAAGLPALTPQQASRFADQALANVGREYPHKLDHVLEGDDDLLPPRELHPAFHGSYDWHSSVHMHWLLATLRRRFPRLPQAEAIDVVLDLHLDADAISAECAYLAGAHTQAFERTYGWAWLLALATELARGTDASSRKWSRALAPLAQAFVERYLDYLPRAHYPIRHGVHANSAFALAFALEHARTAGVPELEEACLVRAHAWFGNDGDACADWEPSGADFLSPVLMEAELMRRVLEPGDFDAWLDRFLPRLARGQPATIVTPVAVSDRSDPQIVHLDGLNLSRAWCWRGMASALPAGDARGELAATAAAAHLRAGLEGLDNRDYVGAHWLASFAALALGV